MSINLFEVPIPSPHGSWGRHAQNGPNFLFLIQFNQFEDESLIQDLQHFWPNIHLVLENIDHILEIFMNFLKQVHFRKYRKLAAKLFLFAAKCWRNLKIKHKALRFINEILYAKSLLTFASLIADISWICAYQFSTKNLPPILGQWEKGRHPDATEVVLGDAATRLAICR